MRSFAFVLALSLVVAAPAAASNAERFADGLGDAVVAPDIGAVAVANDDRGTLSWSVGLANRAALLPRDVYVLWLDVDLNTGTGAGGADFAVVVHGGSRSALLARFSGGRWSRTAQTGLRVRWADGLRIDLPSALAGRPTQVDFALSASAGGETDRTPFWRFGLIVSP